MFYFCFTFLFELTYEKSQVKESKIIKKMIMTLENSTTSEENDSRLSESLTAEVVELWNNCHLAFLRGHPDVEEILDTRIGLEDLWIELDSVGAAVVFCFWKKRHCHRELTPEEWESMTAEEKAYHVSDVCAFVSIPPDVELSEELESMVQEKREIIQRRNRGY